MNCSLVVRASRRIAVAALALLLSGCAGLPRQDLDLAAAKELKRIDLLRVDDPERLRAPIEVSPALGLLGPLGVAAFAGVGAQRMEQREPPFTAAMRQQQASFAELLADELVVALREQGRVVQYLREQRPMFKEPMKPDFSTVRATGDALLYARIDELGFPGKIAFMQVTAWLVVPGSGRQLFQRTLYVGVSDAKSATGNIVPASDLHFKDFDELMSEPARAAEALRLAVRKGARDLAQALR